jgi:DNA-binding FadR family transcriptional regulator
MMSGDIARVRFARRSRTRLHASVSEDVAAAIVAGEIPPGAFLPTEMNLAGQFGVSRTVIREAVKVLATKGLVEVLHGQGVRVLPPQSWNAFDPLILHLRERNGGLLQLLRELLQVRRLVEIEVAALAAEMATAEELVELQRLLAQMDAPHDLDAYNRLDLQLHDYLATITHNSLLPALLRPVSELLALGRDVTLKTRGTSTFAQTGHREIVEAVVQRDPAAARAAMERHLRLFEDDIQQAYLNHEGPAFAPALR